MRHTVHNVYVSLRCASRRFGENPKNIYTKTMKRQSNLISVKNNNKTTTPVSGHFPVYIKRVHYSRSQTAPGQQESSRDTRKHPYHSLHFINKHPCVRTSDTCVQTHRNQASHCNTHTI